jgi:cellulose synthase/poly-beta-1,6-N-acetylglucosamine synthase-like glycosyltransferase
VDIFMPAYNEPLWVVERALRAANKIHYPHTTYLLDDSPKGLYKDLAEKLKTEYLTREGNLHFKAGNINKALERTSGEFIAIFDIDHAPNPEFLDRTLGFFKNERIGFVQVMETFCNADESLMSEASAQTAVEYFNITLTCKDQVGACSHHGTNAVIRRKALESIGGYQPGLAEDLETSVAIHSKGWESAYVCEPLAPGIAPSGFQAFCKQQLKWSRGVFEAAWNSFRKKYFFKLTWHQKLSYGVRFYYYIIGFSFFWGMSLTLLYLLRMDSSVYEGFLARLMLLSVISLLIRYFMLREYGTEPMARKGLHFKGTSLVLSIWPIYVLSLVCTITRIQIPFMSTPKEAESRIYLRTIVPQMIMFCALAAGVVWKVIHWSEGPSPLTLLFAMMLLGQHWMLFALIWKSIRDK